MTLRLEPLFQAAPHPGRNNSEFGAIGVGLDVEALRGMADSVKFMDTLDITAEEKELIMSGNAAKMFNLPA